MAVLYIKENVYGGKWLTLHRAVRESCHCLQ